MVSQSSLIFYNLHTFEENWPDILCTDVQVECVWGFLMIRLGFLVLGEKITEGRHPSYCIISTWFIISDVNFHHLVKTMSAKFIYCVVSVFPFSYAMLCKPFLKSSPHSKGRKLSSTYRCRSAYIDYLECFSKEDGFCPYFFLFIYLLIMCQLRDMFIFLGLW